MKNKSRISWLPLALISLGLIAVGSCVKTDEGTCVNGAESPVYRIEGADTTTVNTADTLKVTYWVLNSCGKTFTFSPAQATQTSNVHISGSYEGCVCTQVAYTKTQNYIFKAPNVGTYTLSFWGGNDTLILEKKIVVQ